VPAPWSAREVAVALPLELAEAVFRGGELWDIDRGGRFDKLGSAVLVWSTNAHASEQGEPVGGFYVRWHDPTEDEATAWKIEWDPTAGGSEAEVWRALELLAGRPLPG
jgi:hypothetical protein